MGNIVTEYANEPVRGDLTLNLDGTTNEFCVAISELTNQYKSSYTLTATAGSQQWICTKSDVNLEAGKYYVITLKMTRNLAAVKQNDVGKVVGADGIIYISETDATNAGTTPMAMIAYVNPSTHDGLAIALIEKPTATETTTELQAIENEEMTWDDASTYCSNMTPVSGGTWCLPSREQWMKMFIGCGVSQPDCVPLNNMLKEINPSYAILIDSYERQFWGCETSSGDKVYYMKYVPNNNGGTTTIGTTTGKDQKFSVRPCLVF